MPGKNTVLKTKKKKKKHQNAKQRKQYPCHDNPWKISGRLFTLNNGKEKLKKKKSKGKEIYLL